MNTNKDYYVIYSKKIKDVMKAGKPYTPRLYDSYESAERGIRGFVSRKWRKHTKEDMVVVPVTFHYVDLDIEVKNDG